MDKIEKCPNINSLCKFITCEECWYQPLPEDDTDGKFEGEL